MDFTEGGDLVLAGGLLLPELGAAFVAANPAGKLAINTVAGKAEGAGE